MKKDKYHKYLKILSKVVPMNDDESFKLGIVLSYLNSTMHLNKYYYHFIKR